MDADQVLELYDGVDFASAGPLLGRAFSHASYDELAVGNVINSFKTATFGNTHPMSLEGLREPTAQYVIVHKSEDGSSDAVRGYTSGHAVAFLHQQFLTFLPSQDGARRTVVLLSETAIRTRGYPAALTEVAATYQGTLT